jgi:NADH:ubiquinone oxidoreductase subunit K
MNSISFGIFFAIILVIISLYLIAFNPLKAGHNLIIIIISLELLVLAVGILFVHFSFILDDLLGSLITLYFLPLAGAESAIA